MKALIAASIALLLSTTAYAVEPVGSDKFNTDPGFDLTTLLAALRDNNPKRDNVASALTMVPGISLLDFIAAKGSTTRRSAQRGERRLYRDRSGFPKSIQAVKEAAKGIHPPSDGCGAATRA